MSKKSKWNLWLLFVVSVFFIMLLSTIFIIIISVFMMYLGFITPFKKNLILLIIIPLFMSTCVGTIFSMLGGHAIVKPIRKFSNAINFVAKGNFTIQLEENQKIYEINEMTINFNKMVAELSSIETLRNDFVTNVSHEFKTPLSTIEGYITLMQSEDLTPEQKQNYNEQHQTAFYFNK